MGDEEVLISEAMSSDIPWGGKIKVRFDRGTASSESLEQWNSA